MADAGPPRRSLRILFLAPQPFFEVRGTPLAVRAMVQALAQLGHRVDLLTYPQGEAVAIAGVTHRRSLPLPVGRVRPGASWPKLMLDVPFVAEAAARLALGRYDVVHAVEEAAHLLAPVASLVGVPLVMDVDSDIPSQLAGPGWRRLVGGAVSSLERYALGRAAAVVTVCASLTEGVRRQSQAAAVFQIEDPPLVDAGRPAAADEIRSLRQALSLDERPAALYTGNFEAYQGVDLLVDAAGLVGDVRFVFVGGEAGDVERAKLRAAMAGTAERLVFVGKRPPAELPAFLAVADVVVSPRRAGENTPFKIYTYLASGKPLVATRLPTHTQLLDDSLAFLVEPTAEGLAAGIRDALRDPAEAGRRAARGLALIEREYAGGRYAQKVAQAYAHIQGVAAPRR
jgi:glycosyltransferase involved in cell wall biosynthesis